MLFSRPSLPRLRASSFHLVARPVCPYGLFVGAVPLRSSLFAFGSSFSLSLARREQRHFSLSSFFFPLPPASYGVPYKIFLRPAGACVCWPVRVSTHTPAPVAGSLKCDATRRNALAESTFLNLVGVRREKKKKKRKLGNALSARRCDFHAQRPWRRGRD